MCAAGGGGGGGPPKDRFGFPPTAPAWGPTSPPPPVLLASKKEGGSGGVAAWAPPTPRLLGELEGGRGTTSGPASATRVRRPLRGRSLDHDEEWEWATGGPPCAKRNDSRIGAVGARRWVSALRQMRWTVQGVYCGQRIEPSTARAVRAQLFRDDGWDEEFVSVLFARLAGSQIQSLSLRSHQAPSGI
ncbi:hypothetical protein NL676_037825 [Syzygium grande]|nr:hypothetical protein NL676_037825 [Syzygium grande]